MAQLNALLLKEEEIQLQSSMTGTTRMPHKMEIVMEYLTQVIGVLITLTQDALKKEILIVQQQQQQEQSSSSNGLGTRQDRGER